MPRYDCAQESPLRASHVCAQRIRARTVCHSNTCRSLTTSSPRDVPGEGETRPATQLCGLSCQSRTPSGISGSERIRWPVAAMIASARAGATATIGASPAPARGCPCGRAAPSSIGRTLLKRGDPILREGRVEDLAGVELDRPEERAAEPHHRCSSDPVHEAVGVHDRAALERGDDPEDLEPAARPRLTATQVAQRLGIGGSLKTALASTNP